MKKNRYDLMDQKKYTTLLLSALLTMSPLMGGCMRVLPEDYSSASSVSSDSSSQSISAPEIQDVIPSSSSEPSSPSSSEIPSSSSSEPEKDETSSSYLPAMSADYAQLENISNEKILWGPGVQRDDLGRPYGSTNCQDSYGKYCSYFIAPNPDKVYLTFDEGYEAEGRYTEKILDVLKEKDAKAVFFITGDYARRCGDLVQRMIDEGHIVGSHSWNHPSMPTRSIEQAAEELSKLHDYVKENFNYDMTLFRFPMGEFSERTLALVQDMGYQSVFWSFAYKDWETDNQPEPSGALKKVVDSAHPGAIYLLHAVSSTNANILGDAIDQLREKGYTVSPYDLPYFERGEAKEDKKANSY